MVPRTETRIEAAIGVRGLLACAVVRRYRAPGGAIWESQVGYSRAVRCGTHVAVTGTTSFIAGGEAVRGNAYEQTRQCLANIRVALQRVGADLRDVMRTRIFVTQIERDWQSIGKAHGEAFEHILPATTMVEVRRLIEPWMLVEVEADAIIGSGSEIVQAPQCIFRRAASADQKPIEQLLRSVELTPLFNAEARTWVAEVDAEIVGSIAGESYGSDALLRSLAVAATHRRQGIGGALIDLLVTELGAAGASAVYALTRDRATYFGGHGFAPIPRATAPPAIAASEQMQSTVCRSAVLLRRPAEHLTF